jgi:hypothetical protein
MWQPRRLTTLWALTACYRDSFTLHTEYLIITCHILRDGFWASKQTLKLHMNVRPERRPYKLTPTLTSTSTVTPRNLPKFYGLCIRRKETNDL